MAKVSTYLNFSGNTEEVFDFYKQVFGGEFSGNGIMRFGDIPENPDFPPLSESTKNMVMHMSLDILNGTHTLMGSDAPEEMGYKLNKGNNVYTMIQTDTREQARELFHALSEGGIIEQELQDMFWGDYYGSLTDKYGVMWMLICEEKA